MCFCMWVCSLKCRCLGGTETLASLELEQQAVVICQSGHSELNSESSVRSVCVLNLCSISSASKCHCFVKCSQVLSSLFQCNIYSYLTLDIPLAHLQDHIIVMYAYLALIPPLLFLRDRMCSLTSLEVVTILLQSREC